MKIGNKSDYQQVETECFRKNLFLQFHITVAEASTLCRSKRN